MYQALYRKWRPSTFEDVVGQEHITTTLKNEMIRESLPMPICSWAAGAPAKPPAPSSSPRRSTASTPGGQPLRRVRDLPRHG